MPRLRSLLLSRPRWIAVAAITAVSVAGSLIATVIAVSLAGGEPHWASALGIALLIPAVVAPASSWPVIGIMHELEVARGEAMRCASTDLLTGVSSRRRFMEIAEEEFSRAMAVGGTLAVILFDIDNFKQVNDHFGHRTGDEVLTRVAAVCTTVLRPGDHIARWGGEEFVALLPKAVTAEALAVAQRLRVAVNACSMRISAVELRVSVSVGVAATDLGVDRLDRLLVMADRAMYDVKRKGKNNVLAAGFEHRTGSYAAFRRQAEPG